MRKVRVTKTTVLALTFIGLMAMSCRDTKKDDSHEDMHSEMNEEMHHDDSGMKPEETKTSNDMMDSKAQTSGAKQIMADYMTLKNALVATNQIEAAMAGNKMAGSLKNFDSSGYNAAQQSQLRDIIVDAKDNAERIGNEDMVRQREHFKNLSKNMMELIAITGTDVTLYQQFCPMYDRGSSWLSLEKDIKNPYYGSKMMTCGNVKEEIKPAMQ